MTLVGADQEKSTNGAIILIKREVLSEAEGQKMPLPKLKVGDYVEGYEY